MPGRSGAWEGSMLLTVHPWTSPPTSLGLSASSCSPLPRYWGAEPSRQGPCNHGKMAWVDTGRRPPAKAMLRPGQTPAQAVRRGRDPTAPKLGWGMGSASSGVGTEWLSRVSSAHCLPHSTPLHVSTRVLRKKLNTSHLRNFLGLHAHECTHTWVCMSHPACQAPPHTPPDPPAPCTSIQKHPHACTYMHIAHSHPRRAHGPACPRAHSGTLAPGPPARALDLCSVCVLTDCLPG